MSLPTVSPKELRSLIIGSAELALLDLREGGLFAQSHLLFAINCPLSRLELFIEGLVPRKDVQVVVCAGAEDTDLCELGAVRLDALGYTRVAMMTGGVEGWKSSGFELFSGVHVPSKAFGEYVETTCGTPHLQAAELLAMQDGDEDFVVLDSRPFKEYHAMNIPGGVDVPGAELVYRIHDLAPNPATKIIVNCAGRTRSIIGAQSLINAGIPNPVMAFENGTMGWHLAGLQLERGQSRIFDAQSPAAQKIALARAEEVRQKYGVRMIDETQALDWQGDASRSTFYLDVRDPSEFSLSHWPGSKSAPGGQLVQATDRYVGVRRARLVLIDNDGVRATMTASWLIQMGWDDVFVLSDAQSSFAVPAAESLKSDSGVSGAHLISVADLAMALEKKQAIVIDLATSIEYRDNGHIAGSWFAIRSRLSENLDQIPKTPMLVLTSDDGSFAELVYHDAVALGREVKVLAGGTQAWVKAGKQLEYGFTHMADDPIDLWYKPYEFDDDDKNIEQAMEQYLTWEVDLVGQIERDGTTDFRSFE